MNRAIFSVAPTFHLVEDGAKLGNAPQRRGARGDQILFFLKNFFARTLRSQRLRGESSESSISLTPRLAAPYRCARRAQRRAARPCDHPYRPRLARGRES